MLHKDTHYKDRPYDTIYLDMDGLLSDFHLEAIRTYMRIGKRFPDLEHDGTPLQLSGVHLLRQWRKHYPGLSLQKGWLFGVISKEEFWHPIDKDPFFWSNMSSYHWYRELISEVSSYCRDLVICTSPHTNPDCYKGKVEWLTRHKIFPTYEVIPCREKWRLAAPGCLLIDDHLLNVEKFASTAKRRGGGEAFLFPTVWNRAWHHAIDPIMAVVRFLDQRHQELVLHNNSKDLINANGQNY